MSLQSKKDIPRYNSESPSFQCDLERLLFPIPDLKNSTGKKVSSKYKNVTISFTGYIDNNGKKFIIIQPYYDQHQKSWSLEYTPNSKISEVMNQLIYSEFGQEMLNPINQTITSEMACRKICNLFEKYGSSDYIGENVSQLEHSLQAAKFAMDATKSEVHQKSREEIVLASLLHDIGHLIGIQNNLENMDNCGTVDHEKVGADFLEKLNFSPRVVKLVKQHVYAKRYLTSKNPSYNNKLSEASKTNLTFQGGPFTPEECTEFEKDPDHLTILKMRRWDEAAKVVGMKNLHPLSKYLPMIKKNISVF